MDSGVFAPEIAPVSVPQARGEPKLVDTDEHPRPDVTAERLGRLSPAFKKEGTVTPGNASGINDGASAVVVMSGSRASQFGPDAFGRGAQLRLSRRRAPHHGHRSGRLQQQGLEQGWVVSR